MRLSVFVSVLILVSVLMFGQAITSPTFQAVKLRPSLGGDDTVRGGLVIGKSYALQNATLVDLIRLAYGVENDKIVGGPNWLDSIRFDVKAEVEGSPDPAMLRTMLRNLLADRFGLVVDNGRRPFPTFVLTSHKKNSRLKTARDTSKAGCKSQPPNSDQSPSYVFYSCRNMTMSAFAQRLRSMGASYIADTQIIDSTGLSGAWDFDVKWTGRGRLASSGAEGISMFDALENQLGLKLVLRNIAAPVLIVNRVHQPVLKDLPSGLRRAEEPSAAASQFEVADIKPTQKSTERNIRFQPGGRVDLQGVSLKDMIMLAWNLDDDALLGDVPKWLDTTYFNVVAKAPATKESISPSSIDYHGGQQRLRTLLADRFGLVTHYESSRITVFGLTVGVSGIKFSTADPSNRSGCKYAPPPITLKNVFLSASYVCRNTTMAQLADKLRYVAGEYVDHPVVDLTGLTGYWDFLFSWTPSSQLSPSRESNLDPQGSGAPMPTSNSGITIFQALDRQLGLKLAIQKHPMPVLVIDKVDQIPTEN